MYSIKVGDMNFNLTSPTQKELDSIPEDKLKEIGERIKYVRQDRGITQAKIAKALSKTSQAYGNIESGKVKRLNAADIEYICKKLNTTYHYLLGLTEDPACGRTGYYCLTGIEKCNKVIEKSSQKNNCYEYRENTLRNICFMKEIDTYEKEVVITQHGKEIFKEDINLDRRKITEYIESCLGDVTISTGGKHIIIDNDSDIYSKIQHLHGDISIFNGNDIKKYEDIDNARKSLMAFLLTLENFVKMKVTKSGRKIEYTIFLNDERTGINLRDERNLGSMTEAVEFEDYESFNKALGKIVFNKDYYNADGLFILDEFIRAMDVPVINKDKLKAKLSDIVNFHRKKLKEEITPIEKLLRTRLQRELRDSIDSNAEQLNQEFSSTIQSLRAELKRSISQAIDEYSKGSKQ